MHASRLARIVAALALPCALFAAPSTAWAQPGKGEVKEKVKEKAKERQDQRAEQGDENAPGLRGELQRKYKTELREHPRMARALVDLALVKEHLEKAAHDFGGHRVEAIKSIDEAIKQIELAMKYDAKHEDKGEGKGEGKAPEGTSPPAPKHDDKDKK